MSHSRNGFFLFSWFLSFSLFFLQSISFAYLFFPLSHSLLFNFLFLSLSLSILLSIVLIPSSFVTKGSSQCFSVLFVLQQSLILFFICFFVSVTPEDSLYFRCHYQSPAYVCLCTHNVFLDDTICILLDFRAFFLFSPLLTIHQNVFSFSVTNNIKHRSERNTSHCSSGWGNLFTINRNRKKGGGERVAVQSLNISL